jgi:hypothetical protein
MSVARVGAYSRVHGAASCGFTTSKNYDSELNLVFAPYPVDEVRLCARLTPPHDMSNRRLPKHRVRQRAVKRGRKLSLRRLSAYVGLSLGALVLAAVVLILVFGGAILNGYGKRRAERAFAVAHPGYALRIGQLDYSVGANRLVAQSVTLSATNTTLKVGRISLTGVRWTRLLWGTAALTEVFAQASLEATNLDAEFPQAHYGIRCARLRASVPGSELIVEGTELRTLVGDEEFFAAHDFRSTRFHVAVPECRVLGLAYGELLTGKSYRARSVHFSRPSFDALVNRDKRRWSRS